MPPLNRSRSVGLKNIIRAGGVLTKSKLPKTLAASSPVQLRSGPALGSQATRADIQTWKPGEVILLTGSLLTGRDAAHKRLTDMLNRGETLPVDLRGRFLYYVGPVQAVGDEAVGPAGPPPPRAWTSSPARSSPKPACSA